jgi:hypothetical protein
MPNTQFFHTKNELVDFISEYLIKHDNTIAIINEDLRKDIVKSLLNKENFNKLNDISDPNGGILFLIKTGDKHNKNLSIKICDAYNRNTKIFKMIDINNLLVIDGLISQEEMKSIIYYKEFTKIQLTEIA